MSQKWEQKVCHEIDNDRWVFRFAKKNFSLCPKSEQYSKTDLKILNFTEDLSS